MRLWQLELTKNSLLLSFKKEYLIFRDQCKAKVIVCDLNQTKLLPLFPSYLMRNALQLEQTKKNICKDAVLKFNSTNQ